MYPKNSATPLPIPVGEVLQKTDLAQQTTGVSARVMAADGTWAAAANAPACDETSGIWVYTPSQAETNQGIFAVALYKAGCGSIVVPVVPTASASPGRIALAAADCADNLPADVKAYTTQPTVTAATLSSAYDAAKTAASAGAAMALTSGERTTLAAAIESAIINELDGAAVMQAIADLIASDMTTTDMTVAAIASAVRDAILNRVLAGNHDTAGTPGKLLQDAATVTSIAALSIPTASQNAAAVRVNLATELGRIDVAVSTRQATVANLANTVTAAAQLAAMAPGNVFTAEALANAPSSEGALTDEQAESLAAIEVAATEILQDTGTALPAAIAALEVVPLAAVGPAPQAGEITIHRGDTFTLTLTGLNASTRTKAWFTLKESEDDTDAEALIQITEAGGLIYLDGETAADASLGSIVFNEAGTSAVVTIKGAATAVLEATAIKGLRRGRVYDFQVLLPAGPATKTSGVAYVTGDVTRAVS